MWFCSPTDPDLLEYVPDNGSDDAENQPTRDASSIVQDPPHSRGRVWFGLVVVVLVTL